MAFSFPSLHITVCLFLSRYNSQQIPTILSSLYIWIIILCFNQMKFPDNGLSDDTGNIFCCPIFPISCRVSLLLPQDASESANISTVKIVSNFFIFILLFLPSLIHQSYNPTHPVTAVSYGFHPTIKNVASAKFVFVPVYHFYSHKRAS